MVQNGQIEDPRNKAKTTRRIMQDCSSDEICSAQITRSSKL
jgi:hypothetical protein